MASITLRGDIFHMKYQDALGRYHRASTKIRVSQYGKRKAERLAMQIAADTELNEITKKVNSADLSTIIKMIDTLEDSDKVKLAILLSDHLPGSAVNKVINHTDYTFSDLRVEWLGLVSDDKSQNWIDKERQNSGIFQKYLDSVNISLISEIKVGTINDFIKTKKDEGKAPNTITNYLKPINQALQYANDNDYIDSNPVKSAYKPGTKAQKEYIHISDAILDAVIVDARETDKIFWTFLRYTGLNPIDVSSLTRGSIRGDNGGRYIDGSRTKSKVNVRIPVHPKIQQILDNSNGFFGVYQTKKERDLSSKRFKEAVLKVSGGKVKTSLGSLRHTFATNLFNTGYSLDEIKLITGHTTTKLLTKTYVKKVDQELAHKAIDQLK